ncbi:Nucleoside diphosphate kinase 6 [Blattella germanica]|nr:Nucleoside diphosphate kinase 6 [Blattella germanica]
MQVQLKGSLQLTMAIIKPHITKVPHSLQEMCEKIVLFSFSGPSEVYILARQDAIKLWRELMGPTKVYQAQFTAPDTIRGSFGLSDTRNATHGSDSPESAKREIEIFFPKFDIDKWFNEEEKHFVEGNVTLCPKEFIHRINLK